MPTAPPTRDAAPAPTPAARGHALCRRLGAAFGVVLLAAMAVGLAVQTARGAEETAGRIDRNTAAAEAALRRVPLLTDAEITLLRRSLNDRHVALAESLSLSDSLSRTALVRVDTLRSVRALDGTYSDPLLTPAAADALVRIADSLLAGARRAGVPAVRPVATSLLRTAASQAALRQVNANAAAGPSSHEFGTTFDLSYRRFEAMPVTVTVSSRVPRPFRGIVRRSAEARATAEAGRLAAEYPSRYAALLARVLIGLEDAGSVVALREVRQTVFHVTAAGR